MNRGIWKFGEMVVFHIPHGIWVSDGWITRHFTLLKTPLGKILSRASKDTLDKIMVELQLAGYRVHNLSLLSTNNLQSPDIIGISSSILTIPRHLEMSFADRGWLSMAVDVSP